jgi:hypothetical protein
MEQLVNEIRFNWCSPEIDALLKQPRAEEGMPFNMHFTQGEEYFIRFPEAFAIPSFPIHHDIRSERPSPRYLKALSQSLERIIPLLPSAFADLSWFFDPAEILKPSFFKLYKLGDELFLYLLRIDLLYRSTYHEALKEGSNDETPAYQSDRLFIESDIIPLEGIKRSEGRVEAFTIRQLISQNWIGETGRGYLVKGIWLDADLSKFFSKVFQQPGRRLYPFQPFVCKYRSICGSVLDPRPEGRKEVLPLLKRAISELSPHLGEIQRELKLSPFSDKLPLFIKLRESLAPEWRGTWEGLAPRVYLNQNEQKEYEIVRS